MTNEATRIMNNRIAASTGVAQPARKLHRRVYECEDCKQRVVLTTNHELDCYPTCKGKCRNIYRPGTSSETVGHKQTTHKFIELWDGEKTPGLILVD